MWFITAYNECNYSVTNTPMIIKNPNIMSVLYSIDYWIQNVIIKWKSNINIILDNQTN